MDQEDLFDRLRELAESPDISPRADVERCCVLSQVKEIGAAAKPVVPVLIKLLEHRPNALMDIWVRGLVADCLRKIPEATEAVPMLRRCMDESSRDGDGRLFRLRCAHALSQIQRSPSIAITEACKLLVDPDPWIRSIAVETLGLLGPQAREALPALCDALSDQDERVRWAAEQAIHGITRQEK